MGAKAVKIKENIYWVGAIDWDLRNFHGYLTQRGSTYNAYLIIDEKVTLVDTVKAYKTDEMLERISSVIDLEKIDYLVCNHVEMDHSGALPAVKAKLPNAKIYTSPNGYKGLNMHYDISEWDISEVKAGDSLSLGKNTLDFFPIPMVHWPDSMATYMKEAKVLLPNDAFGQHIASNERFDDELEWGVVAEEAKKYYANIVLPYGNQVGRALATLGALDIEIICPSHGVIMRSHIADIVKLYQEWSAHEVKEKAIVVYDTMWDSTKKMALSVVDVFNSSGIPAIPMNLQETHISDIMTEVIDAKYICVGSPTLNNGMLPTVAKFLCYFKGLAPKGRKGFGFGSYGWGGQSAGDIEKILGECGLEILLEKQRIQYVPSDASLEEFKENVKQAINNV